MVAGPGTYSKPGRPSKARKEAARKARKKTTKTMHKTFHKKK